MGRFGAGIVLAGVGASISAVIDAGMIDKTTVTLVSVYIGLALLALALAALLRLTLRVQWATCIAIVWMAGLCWFVGVPAVVACGAVLFAAMVVGRAFPGVRSPVVGSAIGLAVIAGIAGWTLTLPIHAAWTWGVLLFGVVFARPRNARGVALQLVGGWRGFVRAKPRHAAALTLLVGLATTACWLPNFQSDDLAYHLSLPTQIVQDRAYAPSVDMMVWAFAPWANDTLHGIVSVLSGRVSHGALNAGWLVLVACLAWRLLRTLGTSTSLATWGVAVAMSVPMLRGLGTGMHTELPATALTLALCTIAFEARRRPPLLAVAALAGGLFALKGMHGFAATPLILYAAAKAIHDATMRQRVIAPAVFVAVGASSYVQAAIATGNPVFPLANGVFASPLAPAEYSVDARWQHPIEWNTLPALFFDTTRYLESGNGALGIAAIALCGAVVLAVSRRTLAIPLLLTVALIVLPFCLVQYARYVLPGIVCFGLIASAASARVLSPAPASIALATCVAAQLLLWPAGNWLLSTRALAHLVGSGGNAAVIARRYLPEMRIVGSLPTDARVLATDPNAPYVARFGRRGRNVSSYAPEWQRAAGEANSDATGALWRALLQRSEATWVLVDERTISPGLSNALSNLGAVRYDAEAHAVAWRLQ